MHNINPDQFQLIDTAVKSTFPAESWVHVETLGGGLSSSVLYKIKIGERTYVARLSDPADPKNNLSREFAAMNLAAEQNLAPSVYYADPQTGIALIDFIESQTLNAIRSDGSLFMDSLADLLRMVHQGPNFQRDIPLTDKVEYIFTYMRPDLAMVDLVQNGMTKMRKLAPLLSDPEDERPCHCDINPGNLLFDGVQLWLLDWEAATQENFYFDLACCCNFFFFQPAPTQNSSSEKAFLEAYFKRPLTAQEEEKYARARTFVTIYYGIMFVHISGIQGASLLTQNEIDALPTYPQFMGQVAQGKEHLDNPTSQQRLGFVYLKMIS